jgi:glutamyl-tRNA synthetase
MPQFAHLPLLLKPTGEGKLSKRDADQMGFPIFPLNWVDPVKNEKATGFREAGYLPEALVNFLAFLGWNPGTTQEIFSMEELVAAFSVERIGKAGTKFDIHKAKWFNQQYLRAKSNEELAYYLLDSLKAENIICPQEKALKVISIMKERATFPKDFWEQGTFLFVAPTTFDESVTAKKWNDESARGLASYQQAVTALASFDATIAKSTLEEVTASLGISIGKILQPLRLSITGAGTGPDLMMIMEIIGKDEVVRRLDYALKTIRVKVG